MIGPNDGKEYDTNGVQEYHNYFGTPTHDDHVLFELLTVGVFQAGLSWKLAAAKLPFFRKVFDNFNIQSVAGMEEPDIDKMMQIDGMIHNQRKAEAVVANARAIIAVQKEFGSFSKYMWEFVDDKPLMMKRNPDIPKNERLGANVAKDMKARGFKFVGPSVTFLFMVAAGMIKPEDGNLAAKDNR